MSVVDSVSIAGRSSRSGLSTAELPLLGKVPVDVRTRLLEASHVERFAPRAAIFGGAEMPKHLHVVLNGIVDLSCAYKGGECTALMMAAGDVFMPAAALYSEPYLISARALTAARILMIDVERVEARGPKLQRAGGRARSHNGRPVARRAQDHPRPQVPFAVAATGRVPASVARRSSNRRPRPNFRSRSASSRRASGCSRRRCRERSRPSPETGFSCAAAQIIVTNRAAAEEFCGPDPYPLGSEYELGVHAL